MANRMLPEGAFVDEYGRLNLPSGATGIISGDNQTTTTGLSNHPYTGEPGNWHYNLITGWIDYSKLGPPAETPYSFGAFFGTDGTTGGTTDSTTDGTTGDTTKEDAGSYESFGYGPSSTTASTDGGTTIDTTTSSTGTLTGGGGGGMGSFAVSPQTFTYTTPQITPIQPVTNVDYVKLLNNVLALDVASGMLTGKRGRMV